MKLQVTQLRLEAAGVISVTLRDPDGHRLPAWAAGAHLPITLPSGRVRQYSLCGALDDPFSYTVAVLLVADGRGGSREIHEQLRIGQILEVGEPKNNFELVEAPRYLFIAGGIGITPILAMMESLRAAGEEVPFRLVYGGRTRASMAFLDRLAGFGEVEVLPQDTHGIPDLATAFAASAQAPACTAAGPRRCSTRCSPWPPSTPTCSCTPNGSARASASPPRAPPTTARSRWNSPAPGDGDRAGGHERARRRARGRAGDALLVHRGFCGTCETKVLAGEVDHRDDLLTDEERQANTTMMICVSRALGNAKLTLDL